MPTLSPILCLALAFLGVAAVSLFLGAGRAPLDRPVKGLFAFAMAAVALGVSVDVTSAREPVPLSSLVVRSAHYVARVQMLSERMGELASVCARDGTACPAGSLPRLDANREMLARLREACQTSLLGAAQSPAARWTPLRMDSIKVKDPLCAQSFAPMV